MASFAVKDAQDAHLPGIAQLAFDENASAARDVEAYGRLWKRLHWSGPYQRAKVLVGVDTETDRVVGHYAMIPFAFRRDGQPLGKGGFVCELRVAQACRNTLLFPQLELKILSSYVPEGLDFAYGLINKPDVLKAHLAFKFKPVCVLPVFARPVRAGKVIPQVVKSKALRTLLRPLEPIGNFVLSKLRWPSDRGVAITQVERFLPEHAAALDTLTRQFHLAAERTVESLNWRFAAFEDRHYKIFLATRNGALIGYVVTRTMPMKDLTALAVVDILFSPDDEATANVLINVALEEAKKQRVDVCVALLNPQGRYYPLLRNRLFVKTPETFTVILHEPRQPRHHLTATKASDWHFTWFDHDFV
ncbi:MAG: hypothetical protein WBD40_07650 [Tepidisphaeraceae bacterium]